MFTNQECQLKCIVNIFRLHFFQVLHVSVGFLVLQLSLSIVYIFEC